MPSASSRVLLLGWNEASRADEPAAPLLRALVQQLSPLTDLSVLLPHEPQPAFMASAAGRVTGLAELDLAVVLAPAATEHPAAWQTPAAPYAGSSSDTAGAQSPLQVPAAPYQGATPATAPAIQPAPERPPVPPVFPSGPAARQLPVAHATALAVTPLSDTVSPPVDLPEPLTNEPDSDQMAAARLLSHDVSHAAPRRNGDEPSTATSLTANQDSAAAVALPAPVARVHATLTKALAALGQIAPSAAAADLNYQVIQYARFASSWALGENFTVIYAVDWPTWLAALEIRQLTGRPLVLHVHTLAQERAAPTETGWAVALERLALRRADLVLAASADIARLLTERYQLPPERLRTVAGTDTATINQLLHHLEQHRPGHPAAAPITPPNP